MLGAVLILASIVIFFITDCFATLKDLKTTRSIAMQMPSPVNRVNDIYYEKQAESLIKKPRNAPPKFKRDEGFDATNDTAFKQMKEKENGTANIEKRRAATTGQTEPLAAASPNSATEPLTASSPRNNNQTEPLIINPAGTNASAGEVKVQHQTEPPVTNGEHNQTNSASERKPVQRNTEPLITGQQNITRETEPLMRNQQRPVNEEKADRQTEPLLFGGTNNESGTVPLNANVRREVNTAPLILNVDTEDKA